MPRPPHMNFPFPFYKQHSYNMRPNPHMPDSNTIIRPVASTNIPYCNTDSTSTKFNEKENLNYEQKNKSNKYNEDYLFDLFGLKIYSDDVLLVSSIYFLYSEDVKDDGLFMVLMLLLLSW